MPAGEAGWPVYTFPAAFGPSRSEVTTNDSFWPLLLPDNRWPLVKLKLVATSPAGSTPLAKAVDIVRLDDAGRARRSLASGVVAPTGLPGAQPNWFTLAPESGSETWAVQVHERLGTGGVAQQPGSFLQLSRVDAYAAEVLLHLTVPAQGTLQLRVNQAGRPAAAADSAQASGTAPPSATAAVPVPSATSATSAVQAVAVDAEFASLRPLSAEEQARQAEPASERSTAADWRGLPGWAPALGLGLLGALLLWWGLRLLRPVPESS
jgi:hypothetical protein